MLLGCATVEVSESEFPKKEVAVVQIAPEHTSFFGGAVIEQVDTNKTKMGGHARNIRVEPGYHTFIILTEELDYDTSTNIKCTIEKRYVVESVVQSGFNYVLRPLNKDNWTIEVKK